MAYDIFISYRRSNEQLRTNGTEIARSIKQQLELCGYRGRIFFDYSVEEMDDYFETVILSSLEKCKLLILVLSRDSMSRVVNEGDWVRREVLRAKQCGLKIVTVDPDKQFDGFPAGLPDELSFLPRIQRTIIHMDERVENDIYRLIDLCINDVVPPLDDLPEKIFMTTPESRILDERERKRIIDMFEMVYVAGGTFTMGASDSDSEAYGWEKPAHSVTLSDYYIGKYEVTQKQWVEIMGANPSYWKGGNLPVENVSWNDIQKFLRELNARTGKNYRLPTEAEWEFAARGGNNSLGYTYSGSDNIDAVAWYDGNSGSGTHPVGSKQPNELGIYDMTGNVWEWCQDWYDNYSSTSQTNPKSLSSGTHRVLRGGSRNSYARGSRVSYRNVDTPGYRSSSYGFRLAASL